MSMLPATTSSSPAPAARPAVDRNVLGVTLGQELGDAQKARTLYEQRWLEDLRQYKGVYAPEITAALKESRRSRVYYRLTTSKINTMVARLMDLLFPQRTRNWSINATPDPMLPPDILAADMADEVNAGMAAILMPQMQQLQAQRIIPDNLAMQKMQAAAYEQVVRQLNTPENVQRVASERAKRMETLIDDLLKECNANGQRRPSWAQNCRSVVHDACLYGMGVLKGPLVERVQTRRYVCTRDEAGQLG